MANPTVTKLQQQARIRGRQILQAEKGLLSKATTLQRSLNNYVLNKFLPTLDISNGRISNTTANLRKASNAKGLKAFIKKAVNTVMFQYYDEQFNTLGKSTVNYFTPFEPTKETQRKALERGEVITNGFIDDLFDNNDIAKKIQQSVSNGVTSNQRLVQVKEVLTEQIKGKEGKLGLIASYHNTNGRNQFQSYSRGLDQQFSTALDLNYAIYAGGTVNDTREFCLERNGQVFNRETILEWNTTPAEWQGRKDNNNILIDMGGYNCRHDFDWISYQLAKRINPEIEKSSFDKK